MPTHTSRGTGVLACGSPRRLLALLGALVAALVALVALSAPAIALDPTTDPTAESTTGTEEADELSSAECSLPAPTDDDTLSVLGRICDRRESPPIGVAGVSVTVTDPEGEVVGEAVSDSDGTFVVDLPGGVFDHLGKTYTITLDEDTVPEDSSPEVTERTLTFNIDQDQSVTFPVGAPDSTGGKFEEALQLVVTGLVFSVVLAMASLGLSVIFGTTGLTNFAHGELVTFGALVAFAVDQLPGSISIFGAEVTVVVGVIAAFLVSGLFGWLNNAALWRPLRRKGTGLIAMMIVSIGLSVFLRNLYQYFAGATSHNYSQYAAVEPWEIGPILLTSKDLIVILVGMAVLVATTSLLQYTRMGKATRAVADNPALSAATGINVERVLGVVWIGGTALTGLAGALLGLTQGFDYQVGFKILLLIFAAVVLGGLGTIWGAIVGAFIIGIFVELTTLFVPAEFKYVGALFVLIIVLLIRPQGMLGKASRVG